MGARTVGLAFAAAVALAALPAAAQTGSRICRTSMTPGCWDCMPYPVLDGGILSFTDACNPFVGCDSHALCDILAGVTTCQPAVTVCYSGGTCMSPPACLLPPGCGFGHTVDGTLPHVFGIFDHCEPLLPPPDAGVRDGGAPEDSGGPGRLDAATDLGPADAYADTATDTVTDTVTDTATDTATDLGAPYDAVGPTPDAGVALDAAGSVRDAPTAIDAHPPTTPGAEPSVDLHGAGGCAVESATAATSGVPHAGALAVLTVLALAAATRRRRF